jgi:serine protease AprX
MRLDTPIGTQGRAGRKGLSWGRASARFGAVVLSTGLLVGLVGPVAVSGAETTHASAASAKVDPGIGRAPGHKVSVIVQAWPGQVGEATAALNARGAKVGVSLPVIDGFQATIDSRALAAVAASPAIKAITANRQGNYSQVSADASAASSGAAAASSSSASASEFVSSTGAAEAWSTGNLGAGVGVAVIDTGISNMTDLKGRIAWGPDLSGEATMVDSYGHGTVVAGLIGGSGTDSVGNDGGAYTGVAPGANLIAVKTSGRNGVADVSTILQAMTWVAAYQVQFNIRVVNLSWGTPSTQSPSIDPLDYAVERLWNSGMVVVVAAGNAGPVAGSITKPGDDPMVLTVGAYDDHTSPGTIPAWSSRGPTASGLAKPDLVAPGRTLIASRSYGSNVEANNPDALIPPSYITGSGTSEATAVTSGLAALLVAAHPGYSPDQVKAALTHTAAPIKGYGAAAQGAGRVQLGEALAANPGPATWQTSAATGLGSIEASRAGNDVIASCNGVAMVITGEIDVRCQAWNPASWSGSSWSGSSWSGSSWSGSSWSGSSWSGSSWSGSSWSGSSWSGSSWSGSSWSGSSWSGSSWSGSSWSGSSWSGSSWSGSSWSTAFWGDHPRSSQHVAGEQSEPVLARNLS